MLARQLVIAIETLASDDHAVLDEQEYSKRLGVLRRSQLEAACARFGLGMLQDATPAPGGLFGQNVFLETDAGSFVLRGHPHGDWQLAKERYFSRLIHEAGTVPVPWPYEIEQSQEIFGWPYAIVPRLAGASGEQAFGGNHAAARNPAFAWSAGTALGRIHQTPVDAAGTYDLGLNAIRPHRRPYVEYIRDMVDGLIIACRKASNATTEADHAWVEDLLGAAASAFVDRFPATVIHLDYAPGNIMGLATEPGWGITGVVDWMTAEAGDPEADIARMLSLYVETPEVAPQFLVGYHAVQREREGRRERFPVYMLLDRLLIWEYGQRNRVWFPSGLTLRAWMEPYLQLGMA